jgi:hypothetical protein
MHRGVGGEAGRSDWVRMEVSFKNKSLLNRMGQRGVQFSGLGWGQVAGCCEHGDELSGYIKWSLARRHVVRAVGCCAVYWRIMCVQGTGLPEVEWEAYLLHGPGVLGSNLGS